MYTLSLSKGRIARLPFVCGLYSVYLTG